LFVRKKAALGGWVFGFDFLAVIDPLLGFGRELVALLPELPGQFVDGIELVADVGVLPAPALGVVIRLVVDFQWCSSRPDLASR